MATPTSMNKTMPTIDRARVLAAVEALGFDPFHCTGVDMSARSITITMVKAPGVTETTTYMIKKD